MKADRKKVQLEMARTCIKTHELAKLAQMPLQTLNKVLRESNVKPSTLGRVAIALNVDVTQIMKEE